MGFIHKAQTRRGRFIQVIGSIIFLGTGATTFVWALWALSTAFGEWTSIFVLIAPIIHLAAVFIVWFSTGAFPMIVLILWLSSWLGLGILALGGMVNREDWDKSPTLL